MGMVQLVPVSLAWLWRLVSPRGFKNPSISGDGAALCAEGVGSYWPFDTGLRVTQANLLLRQLLDTPETLKQRLEIAERYGCCAAIGLYCELKTLA